MSLVFCPTMLQRAVIAALMLSCFAVVCAAQNETSLSDDPDPVKLFERGQAAHARGDFERALGLYDEALKVRPEFPEAEFQKASVLISLNRLPEAESSLRRAIELRKEWSLPYSSLGVLLTRLNRDAEAIPVLQRALQLDKNDGLALRALASLKLRTGESAVALSLAQRATTIADASSSAWLVRAQAERATGDKASARTSLTHALELERDNVAALVESADLALEQNEFESAIETLKTAQNISKGDKQIASRLALAYERSGKPDEARRIAVAAGIVTEDPSRPHIEGTAEEIAAANSDDQSVSRKALLKLVEKNPRNPMLLARLGASYRTEDPNRALDLYRRAAELQPSNPEYATGYAAALVRSRRFEEATRILRQVLAKHPNNYTAHANLATALYEQKRFIEAISEYEWLLQAKPDVVVAHYFIASAHDYLGEYQEALASYESFLAHADSSVNRLEIDKVNLRLPLLRRQIKRGEGVKRKP